MKHKIILYLVLVLSGALLTACEKNEFLGFWEVDVDTTVAQYERVPVGWESVTLAEYKNQLRDELGDRAYKFTGKRPQKPDWGDTDFQGSIEIRREGKMEFFGAWRIATNQPATYELFNYAINSGASYWRAGNIRIGTNRSQALLYYDDPKDKPLVLRRK